MKLLYSLILIIAIAFNLANSVAVGKNNKLNRVPCFLTPSTIPGISAYIVASSYENNVMSSNGQVKTETSFQQGIFSIDFNQGDLYYRFVNNDLANGQSKGELWEFSQNSTSYYYDDLTGDCYSMPMTTPVPKGISGQPAGTSEMGGSVVCDVVQVDDAASANYTTITFLADQSDCSIISGNTNNFIGYPEGFSLINFYQYIPSPNTQNLPSQCLSNDLKQIDSTSNTLTKKELSILSSLKNNVVRTYFK